MAEAGWAPYRIHQLLQQRGVTPLPSRSTVLYWCDEDRNARHRARSRRHQQQQIAERATFRLRGRSRPYREAFVVELRQAGLSVAAIAGVTSVVFDEGWPEHTVRRVLAAHADELGVAAVAA